MANVWVYISSEPGLWTVGFYRPDGKRESESDHQSRKNVAHRARRLNGGSAGSGCFSG